MAILDNAKELARLVQEVGKIELYKQAVELMGQITDLATENLDLKQQVADLKKKLEIKGAVTYDPRNHTYMLDGHGAYCATCYDQHGALQRLHASEVVQDQNQPQLLSTQFICQRCHWSSRGWTRISKEVLGWV